MGNDSTVNRTGGITRRNLQLFDQYANGTAKSSRRMHTRPLADNGELRAIKSEVSETLAYPATTRRCETRTGEIRI